MKFDELSNRVIGCALEVHRHLGPGLLESAYEQCLAHELAGSGIPFEQQAEMPVAYKEVKLDCGYRIDLLVDRRLVVELKCVQQLLPIHEAQLLTYMKVVELGNWFADELQCKVPQGGHQADGPVTLRALRAPRGKTQKGKCPDEHVRLHTPFGCRHVAGPTAAPAFTK